MAKIGLVFACITLEVGIEANQDEIFSGPVRPRSTEIASVLPYYPSKVQLGVLFLSVGDYMC